MSQTYSDCNWNNMNNKKTSCRVLSDVLIGQRKRVLWQRSERTTIFKKKWHQLSATYNAIFRTLPRGLKPHYNFDFWDSHDEEMSPKGVARWLLWHNDPRLVSHFASCDNTCELSGSTTVRTTTKGKTN